MAKVGGSRNNYSDASPHGTDEMYGRLLNAAQRSLLQADRGRGTSERVRLLQRVAYDVNALNAYVRSREHMSVK